jgi:predicted dehydrogenase
MGLGRAMFDSHYPVFKAHSALFEVVAACDTLKERRDIVAQDYPKCKMFRQYSDMLDERDIDLVVIATSSVSHVEHALLSLERGFWTLLETPMALTYDDAQLLRGAAIKAKNRLLVFLRGMFEPDYLLAKTAVADSRLGELLTISIRKTDFVRRDDWQTMRHLGGGATYYAMPDLMLQALKLLGTPPIQMWSELKRVLSLGDVEDCVHVRLKTRTQLTADIEYNGGYIAPEQSPSFVIKGTRGTVVIMPGASTGTITMISPDHRFPRKRSSVRVQPLKDVQEKIPIVSDVITLPKGTKFGQSVFWKHVYDTVRTAAPFPFQLEDSIDAVKLSQLMKKTSPFGK